MDKITLHNYRCFRDEQSARLAPLTFLVGENSTGKTSFQALIRALWDVAFANRVPDFREGPYNLGSFREIIHNRGGRGRHARTFEAGFEYAKNIGSGPISYQATFEERSANPFPSVRRVNRGGNWIEARHLRDGKHLVKLGKGGIKEYISSSVDVPSFTDETRLTSLFLLAFYGRHSGDPDVIRNVETEEVSENDRPGNSTTEDGKSEESKSERFNEVIFKFEPRDYLLAGKERPFASAPVRSRPLRTYDPARPWSDPEGEYIPDYLASGYHRDPDGWKILKGKLENFGQASRLFDEISIKSFGKSEGTPFQVQIRKFSENRRLKGPQRNLIDVGYGVSQALPLLTELLRADAPDMFLLQQPEVHLHPTAQAALGSLFCALAGPERQLIVETHSDYILQRVCMDIRDKTTELKPEDVSILYFEPGDLDVKIHSIRLDEYGNIRDAPPNYRQFFMEETRRFIGL